MLAQAGNLQAAKAALDAGAQPVEPERHPARAGFQVDHPQARMAFQHAAHDERGAGQHIADGEGDGCLRRAQARNIVVQHVVGCGAGAGMDG